MNGSVSVALNERKLKCEHVSQTSRITYCTTSSMIVTQKSLLLVCILMVKGLFCSAQSVCDVLKHSGKESEIVAHCQDGSEGIK